MTYKCTFRLFTGSSNFDQKQINFMPSNLIAKISLHDKIKRRLFKYSGPIDPEYKTTAQL